MKTKSQEIGVISSPAIRTQSSNVERITREEFDRIIDDLKRRHEKKMLKLKQVTLDMVKKAAMIAATAASRIVVAEMTARNKAQISVTSPFITQFPTFISAPDTRSSNCCQAYRRYQLS